ncbi:MAG: PAS domain-containing protein [Proteobacteria bacterium]|nr:PAS domain-containing protein [Burkholderiales bacterium]
MTVPPAPVSALSAGSAFAGLDVLVTAVLMLDDRFTVRYANPAAENLFALSRNLMLHHTLDEVFSHDEALSTALTAARTNHAGYSDYDVKLNALGRAEVHHLICSVTPIDLPGEFRYLLEMRPITQQIKAAREERILDQTQANRELVRNLAHEIRNPLGGIRGAAQLLDAELDRADLREYTRVVMQEADRLQSLMDRMLTPHRLPQLGALNIHEVVERVRSVIVAEFPDGIRIRRDYDTSLPMLSGDREQLIQAVLNIVRNAAQAMDGHGEIELRTRIARSITLARRRYRHAITLQVIDNGPGISDSVRERVFYPLVSGREGGSGLGLTLAQTFINQHHGTIEFDSVPGRTCFTVIVPLPEETAAGAPGAPSGHARNDATTSTPSFAAN